jgi:hypothetical protein
VKKYEQMEAAQKADQISDLHSIKEEEESGDEESRLLTSK